MPTRKVVSGDLLESFHTIDGINLAEVFDVLLVTSSLPAFIHAMKIMPVRVLLRKDLQALTDGRIDPNAVQMVLSDGGQVRWVDHDLEPLLKAEQAHLTRVVTLEGEQRLTRQHELHLAKELELLWAKAEPVPWQATQGRHYPFSSTRRKSIGETVAATFDDMKERLDGPQP